MEHRREAEMQGKEYLALPSRMTDTERDFDALATMSALYSSWPSLGMLAGRRK